MTTEAEPSKPLGALSSEAILSRLAEHWSEEARPKVEFLIALAELDRRKYALEAGFPSLWALLTKRIGMSEGKARRRVRAARIIKRHPQCALYLTDGSLEIGSLLELEPALDAGNADEVLQRAQGLCREQLRRLVAAWCPREAPRDIVEPAATGGGAEGERVGTAEGSAMGDADAGTVAAAATRVAGGGGRVTPVDGERSTFQMTAPQSFFDDLSAIKQLLAHRMPGARMQEVLIEAVKLARATLEKTKLGTGRPPRRNSRARAGQRYIPKPVAHTVWNRDGGACAFVGKDDQRCGSKEMVEFEHIDPAARGGAPTVENTMLLCRAHNQYMAEQVFGEAYMAEKRAERRAKKSAPKPPSGPPRAERDAQSLVSEVSAAIMNQTAAPPASPAVMRAPIPVTPSPVVRHKVPAKRSGP